MNKLILIGISALLTTPCIAAEVNQAENQETDNHKISSLKDWQQPATTVQEWSAQIQAQEIQIQAQQPGNQESGGEEEELVITGDQQPSGYRAPNASTATKTDTPIRDIPQSIQVIPQEVIRDQGLNATSNALGNAVQNVSGVTNLGLYQGFENSLKIRGFRVQAFDGNYFRDGIRYFTFGAIETADLERVEVLKGPASILFGAAEPGGVINLVSKQPLRNPFYSVEGSVGSYRSVRVGADFSGSINSEKTALYRFNGYYKDAGSFRDFVSSEGVFLSPVVQLNLGQNTTLSLNATYRNERRTTDDGFVAIGRGIADLPRDLFWVNLSNSFGSMILALAIFSPTNLVIN